MRIPGATYRLQFNKEFRFRVMGDLGGKSLLTRDGVL